MLWLKSKTQLNIIPKEAPVGHEIKTPSKKIKLKIKNDHVGKVEKGSLDTSQV